MIDYGTVYSGIRPQEVKIDDFSVWVSTDIKEINEYGLSGFSFLQKRYTKDEYIKLLGEENGALSEELTNTQLALCELYEGMV
jgi:hypothetical protein